MSWVLPRFKRYVSYITAGKLIICVWTGEGDGVAKLKCKHLLLEVMELIVILPIHWGTTKGRISSQRIASR